MSDAPPKYEEGPTKDASNDKKDGKKDEEKNEEKEGKDTGREKATRPDFVEGNELDLCFALDCTGSMGSYIHTATESIKDIAYKLIQSEKAKINFALIAYRDHPPQDLTYVTNVHPFTSNIHTMKQYLSQQSAQGGGDGPEAVTAALYEALHLPWRPNATKVLVIIADAPPHGLGESGDGFPNGDPNNRDPIQIINEMRANGITIFSVACEPALSRYTHAVDFFQFCATATGGTMTPLTRASLLPSVIIGGAKEQMEMEKLLEQYEKDAEEAKKQGLRTDEEVSSYVHGKWSKQGVTTHQTLYDDIYTAESRAGTDRNVNIYMSSKSLAAASKKTKPVQNRLDSSRFPSAPASAFPRSAAMPLATSATPFAAGAPKKSGMFGGWFGGATRSAPAGPPPAPAAYGAAPALGSMMEHRDRARERRRDRDLHGEDEADGEEGRGEQTVKHVRDTISVAQMSRLHQQHVSRSLRPLDTTRAEKEGKEGERQEKMGMDSD
ncbi:hypothetical protein HK097_007845 [Rhizophlyctis rosea]|uniref:VWFA domain-containing protein n=1 Tax=Rhizophlyctis rosea TaxID=64517 RepID=A0AAD5SCL8_9FUNG|nr:hypothetical protein HK097_007845 [Rhizophlyctis rosea]